MSVNPPPARRTERGLDKAWDVAGAPPVLIVLAVLLAVTVAVAAVFPQLPAGLDAPAADRWLTATAAAYGSGGAFLRGVGAFDVFNTPWTVVLLAALAFHLVLRVAAQLAHLLRRRAYRHRGEIPPLPAGLPFAAAHARPPFATAVRDCLAALEGWTRGGRRTRPAERGRTDEVGPEDLPAAGASSFSPVRQAQVERRQAALFGERRAWAAAGPLLGYVGPLVVILGLLWNGISGWRAPGVALAVGETAVPSQAQGLAVTLDAAGEGVAQLVLARGNLSRAIFIGENRPGRWGGIWAAERATGPVLAVQAKDVSGAAVPVEVLDSPRPAAAGAPVSLRFREGESEQAFAIRSQGLVLQAVSYPALPERGIDRPVFFIEGYQGDDPTPGLSELVEDAAEVEWLGLTFSFQRDRYVVVDLAAMPGLPLILAGALLTLLGALLTLWLGNTRAWTHVTDAPDGVIVAVRASGPALPQATASSLLGRLALPVPAAPQEAAAPAEGETTPEETPHDA